ncbi:MAG: beta-ketoacyl-[acyl-carrier-protein] synthase family protein [Kofleriaceae bacterium]
MTRARRAVITGVGCASGLGLGWRAFVDGLRAGRCAVAPLTLFDASALPCSVGAETPVPLGAAEHEAWWRAGRPAVRAAALRRLLDARALRDRKLLFAVLAAAEAWADAGLAADAEDEAGTALCLGVGVETALFADLAHYLDDSEPSAAPRLDWRRDPELPLPAYRARGAIEWMGDAVVDALGLAGPVALHASACAAGALAVAHAAAMIRRGQCRRALAGAADSMLNPGGVGGMATLGATSPRAAPDACRPFDRRRDGIAIGEGGALFVLEDEALARARGATILAAVVGWGSTQDAHRPSAPEPSGAAAAAAMRAALARAGLAPEELGYLNAHGTGTALNDVAEARAIRAVFGRHAERLPVSSIKGACGHLMAASGAIELAAALVALREGFLPGTCHLDALDEECPIFALGPAGAATTIRYAQSNSFGFGGQNASVILEAP